MYYKLGLLCFITNQGKHCCKLGKLCCYKIGQVLLQIWGAITNQDNCYYKIKQKTWGKTYYKLGQVLPIMAVITNWGITGVFCEFANVPGMYILLSSQEEEVGTLFFLRAEM